MRIEVTQAHAAPPIPWAVDAPHTGMPNRSKSTDVWLRSRLRAHDSRFEEGEDLVLLAGWGEGGAAGEVGTD